MEKDSGTVFRELKEDVSAYVELKLELLKLSTYERTGKVIAVLSYGLILLFLAFFAILFIFLALGFFLGDWLGSSGFGFGIVAVPKRRARGSGRRTCAYARRWPTQSCAMRLCMSFLRSGGNNMASTC